MDKERIEKLRKLEGLVFWSGSSPSVAIKALLEYVIELETRIEKLEAEHGQGNQTSFD